MDVKPQTHKQRNKQMSLFPCRWRDQVSNGSDQEKIEELLGAIGTVGRNDLVGELQQQYL